MALKYVARGDAPLGVVYTTDAISEPLVRIAGTFTDSTHASIGYPVVLTIKQVDTLANNCHRHL